jgi:hypothetical protein
MRIIVDAAHHADLDPDRISHKNTVRIIRSRVWMPDLSPLSGHDDHYRCLLREVAGEIHPPRRDRSYPRVIKRKMSNFAVKRPHHRQRHRHSRPPDTSILITPPSKAGRSPRPARST